ncbi:NUDIX domain-containing protein, partial [Candidatus Saccharibacteria bacterium]|nr:NUDIX domain-containing protein [Candidatus Saccharibacteria bacterium]
MPKHYVDITFVADWESGEPQNTAPEETSEWVWCALDDLPSPLFPPLKKYLDGIDDQTILYH